MLDPDQAGHTVGPDLGPNYMLRSPTDDKVRMLLGKGLTFIKSAKTKLLRHEKNMCKENSPDRTAP